MKITIISASQRHKSNSQSMKVARYMSQMLIDKYVAKDEGVEIISLSDKPYPLWDEGIWDGEKEWSEVLAPIVEKLSTSDAFIFIVPEYHGMAPAALKNFLLMHNRHQIGHKPVLLIGVSSSDGGAYPLAELRMNSAKNNRLCYIPEQLVIRHVESVLNDKTSENNVDADTYFKDRIQYALGILEQYAIALKGIRESGVTATEAFNNGM
ncbi:MAG TPA: NADPH-dependent oxidoreductase [Thiothrix sp.]|nr:NADPH-dependent oxidoreductase [Thiothrix sp.]